MKYGYIAGQRTNVFYPDLMHTLGLLSYELCILTPEQLADFFEERNFSGINVAYPYKDAVLPFLDEVDSSAAAVGAVNTVLNKNGILKGYNTNIDGFRAVFKKFGIQVTGRKVLIAGTGTMARAAAFMAKQLSAAEVIFISRHPNDGCVSYDEARCKHADAQVFINTTPVGTHPDISGRPINIADFPHLDGVVDTIFNPLRTNLILDAEAADIPACGGMRLFAAQAGTSASLLLGNRFTQERLRNSFRALCNLDSNIVLIGLPHSRRDEVAKVLSERLGRQVIDTTQMLEQKSGRNVDEILQSDGEACLYAMESEIIREIAGTTHAIIITGNGLTSCPENIRYLSMNGTLFFVDRTPDLLSQTNAASMSFAQKELYRLFESRIHGYLFCADEHIDGNGTPEEVAKNILEIFNREEPKKARKRR